MSVGVLDPEDPFPLVSVSGAAVLETEGADEIFRELAIKYVGSAANAISEPGEVRLMVWVVAEHIIR
ncbi:hypothetical protein GCM10022221_53560 [Actinocorallia aurea]